MSKFSFLPRSSSRLSLTNNRRAGSRKATLKASLSVEALEDRSVPSCTTVSGFVFQDANNNGIMDLGELPIAGSTVELHNDQGQIIATATTDAAGFYKFDHNANIDQSPATLSKTVTFPTTATDYTLTGQVDQFDPALGDLQSVEIVHNGSITSEIKVENTSPVSTSTIHGTVGGTIHLTGPNVTSDLSLSENAGVFSAGIFDGVKNYGGTSGTSFGAKTADGQQSFTLTGSDLTPYIGTGKVTLTENAQAASNASGGGNLDVSLNSSGQSTVKVIYHYIPSNCIKAGNYTIVQTSQPAGFIDGKESQNGVVVNNPTGTDSIAVTLADDQNLTNNDFAELKAASLSGHVYSDANKNGVLDPGEAPIAGVAIALTGFDDNGPIALNAVTDNNGVYTFKNLRPGSYAITETQPAGYNQGQNTVGSLGGAVSDDSFNSIVIASGAQGTDYNFGEILAQVADLGIVKTAAASTAVVGSNLSYTLTVTNYGTFTAKNVQVTESLPTGAQLLSAGGNGWTISNTTGGFTATRPDLAVNASSQITLTIKVPGLSNTITNTSTVTSDTPDNNPANNQSQVTTPVTLKPIKPIVQGFGQLPIISKNQLFLNGGDFLSSELRGQLAFVDAAYRTTLGRPATPAEAMAGIDQLKAGVARDAIVSMLWNSDARAAAATNQLYQQYLHRTATPAEAASTSAALKSGTSELDVAAALLSSQEYQDAHAGAEQFVGGLFRDVLNKLPDAQSQQDLIQSMNTQTTAQVATAVLTSHDSLSRIVDDTFRTILRRPASAAEIQTYSSELSDNTLSPGGLMRKLLGSAEFYQVAFANEI